jgi:hypothetical protein
LTFIKAEENKIDKLLKKLEEYEDSKKKKN